MYARGPVSQRTYRSGRAASCCAIRSGSRQFCGMSHQRRLPSVVIASAIFVRAITNLRGGPRQACTRTLRPHRARQMFQRLQMSAVVIALDNELSALTTSAIRRNCTSRLNFQRRRRFAPAVRHGGCDLGLRHAIALVADRTSHQRLVSARSQRAEKRHECYRHFALFGSSR